MQKLKSTDKPLGLNRLFYLLGAFHKNTQLGRSTPEAIAPGFTAQQICTPTFATGNSLWPSVTAVLPQIAKIK